MDKNTTIKLLHSGGMTYQRDAVSNAVLLQKEITPDLIKILDRVAEDPDTILSHEECSNAHLYALALLSQFKEPLAHPVITKLFSLPDPLPADLCGDYIYEEYSPVILYRTSGGGCDRIKSLITNRAAALYSRIYAMESLVFAVGEGVAVRDDIVNFFGHVLKKRGSEDRDFWSFLAWSIHHLYPAELIGDLKAAFDDGLIDTEIIEYRHLEKSLESRTIESSLEVVRKTQGKRTPSDVHGYFSWWKSPKVGRNDPCPCGSGKKYKKCCL